MQILTEKWLCIINMNLGIITSSFLTTEHLCIHCSMKTIRMLLVIQKLTLGKEGEGWCRLVVRGAVSTRTGQVIRHNGFSVMHTPWLQCWQAPVCFLKQEGIPNQLNNTHTQYTICNNVRKLSSKSGFIQVLITLLNQPHRVVWLNCAQFWNCTGITAGNTLIDNGGLKDTHVTLNKPKLLLYILEMT